MSTIIPTLPLVPPPLRPRRIIVDEYERIIASRSLNEPKKIELIDGYLVTKMSKSVKLGFSIKEVLKALERIISPGWTWRQEQPVRIPPYDEPEPDITIVRGSESCRENTQSIQFSLAILPADLKMLAILPLAAECNQMHSRTLQFGPTRRTTTTTFSVG